MRTVGWIGMFALAFVVPCPARGQVPRPTPDEFRSAFNGALSDSGLTMRLAAWKLDAPGSLSLTALVTPNIRAFAQIDRVRRLSSVLFVMHTAGTLESVVQIVATVAATTYAANPELALEEREMLFGELGFHDQGWSTRGLDGITFREGLSYRVIHPGSDTLVMALVSWSPGTEPANPFAF